LPVALALALLALGALRHYGYEAFPPAIAARVWNIHGALVMLALVVWSAYAAMRLLPDRSAWARLIGLIALWWVAEELLVIGCNTAWLIRPWPLVPGQSACYPLWHFDLGKLGAACMAFALWCIVHLSRRINL
jgi:hypothetical protein